MKFRYFGAIVLVFSLLMFCSAQTKPDLQDLSWMAGCWEGRQGEAIVEEHWSKPDGHSMLGFNRIITGDQTTAYQFLQFRQEGDSLVFISQPQGGPRVTFKLFNREADKFIFDNVMREVPHRISYQRQGQMMLASIVGMTNGKSERVEYIFKRVRCV